MSEEQLDQSQPESEKERIGRKLSEYSELIRQAYLLGMSNKDIAEKLFNISLQKLEEWFIMYPSLAQAAISGAEQADMLVANALHKSATGYETEEEVALPQLGVVTVRRYHEPSVNAIKFWLTNRQPKKWKNKTENNLSGEVGLVQIVVDKDDEEL